MNFTKNWSQEQKLSLLILLTFLICLTTLGLSLVESSCAEISTYALNFLKAPTTWLMLMALPVRWWFIFSAAPLSWRVTVPLVAIGIFRPAESYLSACWSQELFYKTAVFQGFTFTMFIVGFVFVVQMIRSIRVLPTWSDVYAYYFYNGPLGLVFAGLYLFAVVPLFFYLPITPELVFSVIAGLALTIVDALGRTTAYAPDIYLINERVWGRFARFLPNYRIS